MNNKTQSRFVSLVNEYLQDCLKNPGADSPWPTNDPRWDEIINYSQSFFLKRLASNFSYYLGNNLDDAVSRLLANLFFAIHDLRNHSIKTHAADYNYSQIVKSVVNNLLNEMRGSKNHDEESIERIVDVGQEPGQDPIDEDFFRKMALLPAFIKTISDIQRDGSGSMSLKYCRIYLAKLIIEAVKRFPDLHSLNETHHLSDHERETAKQLEQQFVLFCMQNQTIQYDTFASILENELGKYHDMTAEVENLRPYSEYCLNQDIELPIVYKVVSSYLYSVGVKGHDCVHAVAKNTISENFNKINNLLRAEIER